MADVEKVISALECAIQHGPHYCGGEFGDENEYSRIGQNVLIDALALLKAQEPVDYIPIDWLMNYAQLPTEFAISAWRKPKKEVEIKHAKSLDKPMSLDSSLNLVNELFPLGQKEQEGEQWMT